MELPGGLARLDADDHRYYRHGGWRKGRMAPAAGKEECEEQALAEGQPTNKAMPVG